MHYFAYSSNMSFEHMRRLCGWHFRVLGAAILQDFEFGADKRGYATIRPKKGSKVAGVLYELDQASLDILDDFDGYPKIFNRIEAEVHLEGGLQYKAWVYAQSPEQFGGSHFKEDFLKRVIAGARENRLPEAWLKFLESFSNDPSHSTAFSKEK
jgi:gamma-glutamylcyclotransferase (GGCT)/AIG2-like uncharacterized protein YtfP